MRQILGSIEGEYRRYKALGEKAIAQLTDEHLAQASGPESNSVTTLVWHISGNLESRFTDFLKSDGEKAWRDRDTEFAPRAVSRAELTDKWERGWTVLFRSLAEVEHEQLQTTVTIRGVPLTISDALHRSLAHASYHVGQIVFLAKALRGGGWQYLTIPPGKSAAYNANPLAEKPPKPPRQA